MSPLQLVRKSKKGLDAISKCVRIERNLKKCNNRGRIDSAKEMLIKLQKEMFACSRYHVIIDDLLAIRAFIDVFGCCRHQQPLCIFEHNVGLKHAKDITSIEISSPHPKIVINIVFCVKFILINFVSFKICVKVTLSQ